MTKEEQNQIIKDTWVRNLQKETDIPSDIGDIYKNWVRGIVASAAQQLTQQTQEAAAQAQQEAS